MPRLVLTWRYVLPGEYDPVLGSYSYASTRSVSGSGAAAICLGALSAYATICPCARVLPTRSIRTRRSCLRARYTPCPVLMRCTFLTPCKERVLSSNPLHFQTSSGRNTSYTMSEPEAER
eukprot:1042947-Rhodomonas_salina.2